MVLGYERLLHVSTPYKFLVIKHTHPTFINITKVFLVPSNLCNLSLLIYLVAFFPFSLHLPSAGPYKIRVKTHGDSCSTATQRTDMLA